MSVATEQRFGQNGGTCVPQRQRPVSTDAIDPLLVLRAQARDPRAFEKLLESLYKRVHRYIAAIVFDAAIAEDINQEVWLQIWRKLPSLTDPSAFTAWVYRTASRAAIKQAAKQRRSTTDYGFEAEALDALTLPARPPRIAQEDWLALESEVRALPQQARTVVQLHYQAELTLEEISAALEVPVGTVKSRLAYGLQMLRRSRGIERNG